MAVSKPSLADAELGEDSVEDFVGRYAAGDGAEVVEDLADVFAQQVGREVVGESRTGGAESFRGAEQRLVVTGVGDYGAAGGCDSRIQCAGEPYD